VLLGTLYPLLLDALGMGKISVGRRTSRRCSCR
jgi:cytochrome c biogenesis factor